MKQMNKQNKTQTEVTVATARMAKATTVKEALAGGEEKTNQKPSEAREIKLYAQIPPVENMDASLSTLSNCEKLSLLQTALKKLQT